MRATTRDKIIYYTTSAFNRSTLNGVTATTAQTVAGGVRYDLNLSGKSFAFGTVDLFNDRFQDLDLRTVLGAGGGLPRDQDMLTPRWTCWSAATFDREFFTTLNRSSAELLLGETFTHKFFASTTFNESVVFLPQSEFDGTVSQHLQRGPCYQLSKTLSWQTTFNDYYLSNPVPGKKSE